MYDPTIGRWISEDPIGFRAADPNLYRYVRNSPVNFTDPSGLAAVGHHTVPIAVLTDEFIRPRLSTEAYELALGTWSGQTIPAHGYRTYGGVTHARYSAIVRGELVSFMEANNVSTTRLMGEAAMDRFINLIERGEGANGAAIAELGRFNAAIRAERDEFCRQHPRARREQPASPVARRARGAWYRGNSGRLLGLMLVPVGWAITQSVGVLEAAADDRPGQPNHFRFAVQALTEGDLGRAERHLFGGPAENRLGGFMGQMIAAGQGPGAFQFQAQWDEAVRRARERANAIGR